MPVNGLVVMTPTSIASTGPGNSSSINADGSVDFASCGTLSLNGVFTSSYDNYMVTMRHVSSDATAELRIRLRTSGTDATASNYVYQLLLASGTAIQGVRSQSVDFIRVGSTTSNLRSGHTIYTFGPYLSQPTAFRSVTIEGYENARILDYAGTHSLSTSYDGFTIYPLSGNITGLVTVFGFNQ